MNTMSFLCSRLSEEYLEIVLILIFKSKQIFQIKILFYFFFVRPIKLWCVQLSYKQYV